MAVEVFKNLFKQSQESGYFSFKKLSQELSILSPKSREKQGVSYNDTEQKIIAETKAAIVKNFCLNSAIMNTDKFNISILNGFMELLDDETNSEKNLAQSFFLLHASKSDFSNIKCSKDIIINILKNLWSIDTNVDQEEYSEYHSMFQTLIKSKNIIKNITNVMNELIEEINKPLYNYSNLKLIFFNSDFDTLCGFSGKDRIYINTLPFTKISQYRCFSSEVKEIALKLEFVRLFIHETSHVVLRYYLGNLNLSSPYLKNESNYKIKKSVIECGIESEKKIFQEVIDWDRSIDNRYNLTYCKKFLNDILSDKFEIFDTEKAEVVLIPPEDIPKVTFSIRFHEKLRGF
ncbi:hypothetical protein BpHYR1_047027 [Brachionus plicatilis]|uniref:Uncharacterized protein n=1 Tax=Brachionus plicatilis TaxID=10195 RepID=A0A3M7SQB6_BRAPC|nr:hypothetical protein BpHYR1_047027 [Brachionus plicatilis]